MWISPDVSAVSKWHCGIKVELPPVCLSILFDARTLLENFDSLLDSRRLLTDRDVTLDKKKSLASLFNFQVLDATTTTSLTWQCRFLSLFYIWIYGMGYSPSHLPTTLQCHWSRIVSPPTRFFCLARTSWLINSVQAYRRRRRIRLLLHSWLILSFAWNDSSSPFFASSQQ